MRELLARSFKSFLCYHIGLRVGGIGLNPLVPEDFSGTTGFLPQFKDKHLAQVT